MLLTTDLKTHLYAEQISVISRSDEELIDEAIAAAEGQAKGYLSRFDIESLFNAEGEDRDKTLLMYLKDMATWHFITLANAGADLEFRESRYKQAIAELGKIQSGKTVPFGWPLNVVETKQDVFYVKSDSKRLTNY